VQFLMLVYVDEDYVENLPPGEQDEVWRAAAEFDLDLARSGHRVAAAALRPTRDAVTVRVRGGRASATAGPFAETVEHLGGFVLVEATDLDEAVRLAETVPGARFGSIEVRPLRPV
jgi:hypothetical protein